MSTSKSDMNQFEYRALVFGFKLNRRLDEMPWIKADLKQRSVIRSEYPPENDEQCEFRNLQYHALLEAPKNYRFDNDRKFQRIKEAYIFHEDAKVLLSHTICSVADFATSAHCLHERNSKHVVSRIHIVSGHGRN
ncbi:hypothetical protein AVEN_139233-1 [Araneus ventricosus]|uniref:Uncharacterized protein n=1 Tax=Araneus ventricosus TaxID=182803 RepID=A0A4Y2G2Z6_ARAVE|nr:hypothetical protein AVEN_139233-1 [Araneus ventricosus]